MFGHNTHIIILIILHHWLQILEEMEREFGISCSSGPSKEHYQEEILDLETCDSQEELERSQSISQKEDEKHKVWRTLRHQHIFRGQNWTHLPFRLLVFTKPGGQAVDLPLTVLELSVQAGPLLLSLVPLFSTGEHPGQRLLCLQVGTLPRWVQVTPAALQSAWSVRQSD